MREKMPYGYASRHRDIERMLCANLRNLKTHVTLVDHLLIDPVDLMSEHESITPPLLRIEILKLDTSLHLLKATQSVALALQSLDALGGGGEI